MAIRILNYYQGVILESLQQPFGSWIGGVSFLRHQSINQSTRLGDVVTHLIFKQPSAENGDHDQEGQPSQALRRMQPHRTDLHWALDEIDGLFDLNLLFVLDHGSACRQAIAQDIGTEQHDTITMLCPGDRFRTGLPVQFPLLVLVCAAQSILQVGFCFGCGQDLVDPRLDNGPIFVIIPSQQAGDTLQSLFDGCQGPGTPLRILFGFFTRPSENPAQFVLLLFFCVEQAPGDFANSMSGALFDRFTGLIATDVFHLFPAALRYVPTTLRQLGPRN